MACCRLDAALISRERLAPEEVVTRRRPLHANRLQRCVSPNFGGLAELVLVTRTVSHPSLHGAPAGGPIWPGRSLGDCHDRRAAQTRQRLSIGGRRSGASGDNFYLRIRDRLASLSLYDASNPPSLTLFRDGHSGKGGNPQRDPHCEELTSKLRQQQVAQVADVVLAKLEGDGHLSVLKRKP